MTKTSFNHSVIRHSNLFRHSSFVIRHSPLLLLTLLLPACCPCARIVPLDTSKLPPPITIESQIQLLNARAQTIPFLQAHIDKLEIHALDEHGKDHHESADGGSLQIRQHLDRSDGSADILLTGTFLAQSVLELGKNDLNFWYAIYGNYKEAHIGTLSQLNATTSDAKDIYRADLHLQMLALSTIDPGQDHVIAMEVDDVHATNHIFLERITPDRLAHVDRQLIIDRYTGHVVEVDLYDASTQGRGSLLARSLLSDYSSVEYVRGATPAQNPPTIPATIQIDFPTLKSTVLLKLSNIRIPGNIKDNVFQPSDFQSEGLKVIPIQ